MFIFVFYFIFAFGYVFELPRFSVVPLKHNSASTPLEQPWISRFLCPGYFEMRCWLWTHVSFGCSSRRDVRGTETESRPAKFARMRYSALVEVTSWSTVISENSQASAADFLHAPSPAETYTILIRHEVNVYLSLWLRHQSLYIIKIFFCLSRRTIELLYSTGMNTRLHYNGMWGLHVGHTAGCFQEWQ